MKRYLSPLLAALLIAGCGGGGDDGEDTTGASEQPAPGAAVFESDKVGFTFEYPKDFAVDKAGSDNVLGAVSIEADALLNAIKVRKTSDQELGTDRYLDEFQRDFARTVGKVDKREETIGDIEMGVLEFDDSVEQLGQQVEFTSVSYFFPGGGRTWQLECIADTEHSAEIDEACMQALESISFDA